MQNELIRSRLAALRSKMNNAEIAGCMIPTDDDHMSEYVCAHWTSREYFSGFTGSAGTLVVLADKAALWTDGRYHLQAGEQLEGTGIDLMKAGLPETPEIRQYLLDNLPDGSCFAFDGRCVDARTGSMLKECLSGKQISLMADFDPAKEIWEDRPALPDGPAELFAEELAGEPAADKIARIREQMAQEQADALILTKLDEIAWLLNMRGTDIDFNPVFLAFLTIRSDGGTLYIDRSKISEAAGSIFLDDSEEGIPAYLNELGMTVRPYHAVYEDAVQFAGKRVMAAKADLNYSLYEALTAAADAVLLDRPSPVLRAKAIKNETEIANNRRTHIADGAAMVRFMKWLKELNPGEDGLLYTEGGDAVTEISAAAHLDALRAAIPEYRELSFPTISGYDAHGAIIHYEATEETDVPLAAKGLFLVDSGGHYDGGTTDITRTFAMGKLTDEEKAHFALVLRCMLHLMNARFPEGVCFENLDVLARLPLWEQGLDFLHGTGHGVGHVLNVHEGPNRFHWRPVGGANTKILPGMVTTDEPGVYIDGKHGIRLENELLCIPAPAEEPADPSKAKYGRFLGFDCLTLCPIDLDAVDPKYLDEREIGMLNAYHARVYEMLAPELTEEERSWLRTYTRPIEK